MAKPLCVLHVVDSLAAGGMENGIVNMAHALEPRGFEMHVACLTQRGVFAERMPAPQRVTTLGKHHGFTPMAAIRLSRQISHLRPSVVHSHNLGPLIYSSLGTLLGTRCPVIQGEHSMLTSDERSPRRLRQRRLLYKSCRAIHTVSEGMRDELLGLGFPVQKILAIRNGVDTVRFTPGDSAATRQEWNIPADSMVVGIVGRFGPFKGHVVLLDAFDSLAASFPKLHLMITGGGGSEEAKVQNRVEASPFRNRIQLTGFQLEPQRCYQALDLLVIPSVNEGLSNAALEAMACGVPVLGNPDCGHEEMLQPGVNGWIADIGTPQLLAAALAALLAQPKSLGHCGRRARENVESGFSLKTMADAYDHLYRSLLPHS